MNLSVNKQKVLKRKTMDSQGIQIKTEPETEPSTSSAIPVDEQPEDSKFVKLRKNPALKKNIAKCFKKVGPDLDNFDEFMKANPYLSKLDPNDISRFIIDFQKKSQQRVEHDYSDLKEYHKLCKLIDLEKDKCRNEIPAALDAITHLELLPGPVKADGIKFVALYKTLSDLMQGNPVEELDDPTCSVLAEAHTELLVVLDSPKGKEDYKKLERYFTTGCYDALPIDNSYKALHDIMADIQWNPLNIQSEFLFNAPIGK